MRKLITITAIFILSFKMNGQNLDDLYASATLNNDFTSTLNSSPDETILRKEFNEWFINNESKFYFESEPNIIWEQKWYWGSTKVLFKSLSFIKPENINRRLAYLEAIRKANERNRPLSATEILHEINEILKIPEVQTGVKFMGKKINQGIDSFKESMKSSYSTNYSNDNSSSNILSSSNSDSKKNTSEIDCEAKTIQEYAAIDKSKIKYNEWTRTMDLIDVDEKQLIEFPDGTSGRVYKTKPAGKYYLSLNPSSVFYDSYESVVRALFIYKKCDYKLTKLGKL